MTTVPLGNIAIFSVTAQDTSGTVRAATGTIKSGDYASAYVAKNSGGQVVLVPKVQPPAGGSIALNVTVSGSDAQGNALPDLVIPFTLQGPPPPPNATQFVMSGMVVRDTVGYPVPADPGSGTIAL